jgi:PPOX class probable F420-dependent enzyme
VIGTNEQFDQFITDHRWAVITTLRANGQPSSSFVAYARDGDTLVVSTPGGTLKRRTLEADPRVTICVTTNQEPFNFVTVEGRATIEHDNLVEETRKVFANIADTGWEEPADLEGWLHDQERVIIRIHPERVSGVIR